MRTEMWNDDKLEGYMLSAQFSLRGSLSLWNISNNSKNIVFSVPVFTYLPVSSLPWLNLIPDLSLLCSFSSQLSSLSLIFLWISVMTPNPSVPLSYPPSSFISVCSYSQVVIFCFFIAGSLCFFSVVYEYWLLSLHGGIILVWPDLYTLIYMKAGAHTHACTQTKAGKRAHVCNYMLSS